MFSKMNAVTFNYLSPFRAVDVHNQALTVQNESMRFDKVLYLRCKSEQKMAHIKDEECGNGPFNVNTSGHALRDG